MTAAMMAHLRRVRDLLARGAQLALNFVREHTPESCTRLCALLCCVTGCVCAVATLSFAFTNPAAAATVAALVGVTSALIAAGCVALLTRTRSSACLTPDSNRSTDISGDTP